VLGRDVRDRAFERFLEGFWPRFRRERSSVQSRPGPSRKQQATQRHVAHCVTCGRSSLATPGETTASAFAVPAPVPQTRDAQWPEGAAYVLSPVVPRALESAVNMAKAVPGKAARGKHVGRRAIHYE
jgi:hypothetical protein